jgi:ligand-binding SRPBCC domain-containing protein
VSNYRIQGVGNLITVETITEIEAPVELCFDLARDIEVHTHTVWKHTKERAVAGIIRGKISGGETVTFEATHFLIRQRLTSKIVKYEKPVVFVDRMLSGAFHSMEHTHEFAYENGKTVMKDKLLFSASFGFIGWMVERLLLKAYMQGFLEHRNANLKKMAEEQYRKKGLS